MSSFGVDLRSDGERYWDWARPVARALARAGASAESEWKERSPVMKERKKSFMGLGFGK